MQVAHRLGRFQRPTAAEDGKATEDRLVIRRQQAVAPFNRRPQRLLPLLSVARPRRQQFQSRVEAFDQQLRRQGAHARSGKLECQW